MAGTLAHFHVMKEYLEKHENIVLDGDFTFKIEDWEDVVRSSELEAFREEEKNDVYSSAMLGATGPDIFYMPTLISISGEDYSHYSDYMHYKNAGLFVKNLYETISEKTTLDGKRHITYLCKGFLSHMATDLVYHPFVNSFVGKYQEHVITKVDVPGPSFLIDGKMSAHNMIEMAQDYYILTELWKGTKLNDKHNMILTNRIRDHIPFLASVLSKAVDKTYGADTKGLGSIINMQNYLDYFVANASGSTFEEYPDTILDNKFNYEPAIKHQKGGENIEAFLDKSVKLTKLMIDKMMAEDWDDILKPWNLDTGLYTEVKVDDNEIKINFKNYESVWG